MSQDLDSVKAAKAAALVAAEALRREISNTLLSSQRIPLLSKLVEVTNMEQDLEELEARISAGASAMPHLSVGQIADLTTLATSLDAKILRGRLLTFNLTVVATVLDSAVRVRDIVRGNIA